MENNDINIKVEELVPEMTNVNVRTKTLGDVPALTKEGKENDAAVKKNVSERGITPETKPSEKEEKNKKDERSIEEKIKQWVERIIIPFLKNKIVIISVIYILFYSLWEDVIEKSLVEPFISHFESNFVSDIIFYILAALLIINCFITEPKRKKKDEHILKGLVSLVFWVYYRFCSDRFDFYSLDSLNPLELLKYIDIVVLYGVCELSRCRSNSKNKITFNDGFERDTPIENVEDDDFNREIFIQDSVNKILNTDTTKGAFSFGIVSPWGTGKSSFMNLMKKNIINNHKDECIIIDFNPWLYAHNSNLITLFFDELSKNIKSLDSTLASDFVDYSKIFSSIGTPETKLASIIVDLVSPPSKLGDKISAINDSIKKLEKKIVVFVDDIDRLDSTEIMEVLKLIRNISNFPYMYFIVAYDKEYLLNCIKGKTHDRELDYAEKVFQIEFVLPQIDKTTIKDAVYNSIIKLLTEEEIKEFKGLVYCKNIVNDNITNIRDVKRIVNSFKSSYSKLKGEIEVNDLFVLEILKNKYPTVYAILDKDRSRVLKQNSYLCYDLFEENDGISYSITKYINDNDVKLHLRESDKGKISELLHQLFPLNTDNYSKKSINNMFHIDRYFNISILESDLSDVEFDEVIQKDEERIKTQFKIWAVNRDGALSAKLLQLKSDNKEIHKRYIRIFLIAVSIIIIPFDYVTGQIKRLKEFNEDKQFSEEDKLFIKETLDKIGYSKKLALYLYDIVNKKEPWDYPLSRTELNEIRQTFFKEYLMINNIFNGNQYNKDVEAGVLIDCILPNHKDLMKEHAMQHIQEFIISTIIEKQPKEYTVDSWLSSKLWDTWDDFIKYLNTIKKDNPIINEYLEFVEKRKGKNFEELIDFTFKQIKLE
ncbi:MAG: hypothetical protein IKK68_00860 [Paludibacteraceae bacterium]|nr:hypothetical protein [Paludibacteraceae bacterium]